MTHVGEVLQVVRVEPLTVVETSLVEAPVVDPAPVVEPASVVELVGTT